MSELFKRGIKAMTVPVSKERTLEDALKHSEVARTFNPESLRETSKDLIVLADEVLRLQKEIERHWDEAT